MRHVFDCMGEVEAGVPVNTGARFSVRAFSHWRCVRSFCCRSAVVTAFRHIELTRRRIPDNRVEPIDNMQPAARMLASCYRLEGWSNADKTADDG